MNGSRNSQIILRMTAKETIHNGYIAILEKNGASESLSAVRRIILDPS